MQWLKLWHDTLNDVKLEALTADQFRVWFRLLVYASMQPIRGEITYASDDVLALHVAKGNVELLHETLKRLETFHCVSSRFIPVSTPPDETPDETQLKRITFKNFEKRNGRAVSRNENTSTERVRKWRDQQKLRQNETVKRDETHMKRNETRVKRDETHMKQGMKPRGRVDGELDGDGELESSPQRNTPPARPSANGDLSHRSEDDLREVNKAIDLLGSDPTTELVAMDLGRMHSASVSIPGWKWLRAAERLISPKVNPGQRTWKYFTGIVNNLTDADREERPAAKKETPAQRKQRELSEGFQSMKAKMLAKAATEKESTHGDR